MVPSGSNKELGNLLVYPVLTLFNLVKSLYNSISIASDVFLGEKKGTLRVVPLEKVQLY